MRAASFDLTAMQRAAAITDVRRAIEIQRKRAAAQTAEHERTGGGGGGGGLTIAASALGGGSAEAGADAQAAAAVALDLAQRLSYAEQLLLQLNAKIDMLPVRPPERRGGGGGGGGWRDEPLPGLLQPGEALFELLESLNITAATYDMHLREVLKKAIEVTEESDMAGGGDGSGGLGGGSGRGGPRAAASSSSGGAEGLRDALDIAFRSLKPIAAGRPPAVRGYRMYVHYERVHAGAAAAAGGGGSGGGNAGALLSAAAGAAGLALEARTLSYWCFLPGVAMHRLLERHVGSVILTSGTLAPLESMQYELQVPFGQTLEGDHVVPREQVWAGVVPVGPTGVSLNSSYRCRSDPRYLDDLGNAIVNFARVVPDGLLVFFPSYAALSTAVEHWQRSGGGGGGAGGGRAGGGTSNGGFGAAGLAAAGSSVSIWDRICRHKHCVVEPRDATANAAAIAQYRSHVAAAAKQGGGGGGSGLDSGAVNGPCGGALFAVCRGRSSEGIDFADRDGRAVIITGIPYASATEPLVRIQKMVLDEDLRAGPRGLTAGRGLSGDQWYSQEATRAVNQAMGRVIRHYRDYGAVLLLDERFGGGQTRGKLSRWLRDLVSVQPSFGAAVGSLARFFKERREADAARRLEEGGGMEGVVAAPRPRLTALQVVAGGAAAQAAVAEGGAWGMMGGGGGGGGAGGSLLRLGSSGQGGIPRAIDLSGFADVADAAAAQQQQQQEQAAGGKRPRPTTATQGDGDENGEAPAGLEAALAALHDDADDGARLNGARRQGAAVGGGGQRRRRLVPDVEPLPGARRGADPRAALRPEGLFLGGGGLVGEGSDEGGGAGEKEDQEQGEGEQVEAEVVGPAAMLAAHRSSQQQQQQQQQKAEEPAGDGKGKLRMGDFLRSWNSTQVEQAEVERRMRQRREQQAKQQAAADAEGPPPTLLVVKQEPPAQAAAKPLPPPAAPAPAPAAPAAPAPDPAAYLARLQRELPAEAFAGVKRLLREYRERRDTGAFADGAVALLARDPLHVPLLEGLAAFMPARDRGWFAACVAPHAEAAAARRRGQAGVVAGVAPAPAAAMAVAARPDPQSAAAMVAAAAALQTQRRREQQQKQQQQALAPPPPPPAPAWQQQPLAGAPQPPSARPASAALAAALLAAGGPAPPAGPWAARPAARAPPPPAPPVPLLARGGAGAARGPPPPLQAALLARPCASCKKAPIAQPQRAPCCAARSLACFSCWNAALAANPRGCKCFGCGKLVKRAQLSAA
jgi:regulator of telomere elongation helicase 1